VVSNILEFSSMPSVHGAIDCTHITISKPKLCPEGTCTMVLQVDEQKRFTDIFVGHLSNVNDSRVLKKSRLYHRVVTGGLFNDQLHHTVDTPLYLLGDKGYPLLPWLLTPFKDDGRQRTFFQTLYQDHHSRGCSMVENTFGILKQTWRELLVKTDMKVEFIPDLMTCYCILQNMILGTSISDIDYLKTVLDEEALLDWLDLRHLEARWRVLPGPRAGNRSKTKDGRRVQCQANVVAYLGGLPQR
jgi:hypothetical protein